jgi:ribosome recycling factor
MREVINILIDETEKKMQKAIEAASREFASIRTGTASTSLVDKIKVECYGTTSLLKEIASITTPEPRLIVVQPWDKSIIADIEKAILKADLGLNPTNDGNIIRIPIPRLTEERREELSKLISKIAEEIKVSIRRSRGDANKELKDLEKSKDISEDEQLWGEEQIQDLTDKYTEKVETMMEEKIKEIKQI